MPDLVGVEPFTAFSSQHAKRELLLFDRIAIPGLSVLTNTVDPGRALTESDAADLDYLRDRELVFEAQLSYDTFETAWLLLNEQNVEGEPNAFTRVVAQSLRDTLELDAVAIEANLSLRARRYFRHSDRRGSDFLRADCQLLFEQLTRPHPVSEDDSTYFASISERQLVTRWLRSADLQLKPVAKNALRIVLDEFPVPDESTPWEAILEYRQDPAFKEDRLALRRWINDVATKGWSTVETKNELEYLKAIYEKHLRPYKIKCQRGVVATIVVATVEAIESFGTLPLSKSAGRLFDVSKAQIDLLQAEATAPGREIAYLLKTAERFGAQDS